MEYYSESELLRVIDEESRKDRDTFDLPKNIRPDDYKIIAAIYMLISKYKYTEDQIDDLRTYHDIQQSNSCKKYNRASAIDMAIDNEIDKMEGLSEQDVLDIVESSQNEEKIPYKRVALLTKLVMDFDMPYDEAFEKIYHNNEYDFCRGCFYSFEHIKNHLAETEPVKQENSDEGCYITTAVCNSFNKPDNCYELTMFRKFRDTYLKESDNGNELIQEYYNTAPQIVKAIDRLENSREIYIDIWNTYLKQCLDDMEHQMMESCKRLYIKMVYELKNRFIYK